MRALALAITAALLLTGCTSPLLQNVGKRCLVSVLATDPDGSNARTIPLRLGDCPPTPK